MSDPPSSQDSTGTQEILSQNSFDEIWQTLGRTFSNPEKIIQGFLTEKIPTVIEYQDQPTTDQYEIIYEQRTLRNGGLDTNSQQLSDINLQPLTATTNGTQNGQLPLINGNSLHPFLLSPLSPTETVHLPAILPNTNYSGKYEFSICFEPNSGPITKATPWVYQQESHKLFVKMQCVCPILFKIQGSPPPGSIVRGILTYKRPENYKDVVIRCPNHKNTCKDGHPYQDHVMRCENNSTRYEACPSTDRLSLVVPLKATSIVVGEGYFKELFKFTCFNSCVGGMNRRPTNLLFRLECSGEVLARAVVEVRICASPGRDCNEKDSVNAQKNARELDKRNGHEPSCAVDMQTPRPLSPAVSSPTSNQPRPTVLMSTRKDESCMVQGPFHLPSINFQQKKRPCTATNRVVINDAKRTCLAEPTDDEMFTLDIRGRDRYEMLLKIKEGLDLLDGIRPTSQSRCVQTENSQSPGFTKIQPKAQLVQVKKEEGGNAECLSPSSTSPPSSQENPPLNLSQLSRTSSNASTQSSSTATEEYSAWQVTFRRTVNLDKPPPRSRPGCI